MSFRPAITVYSADLVIPVTAPMIRHGSVAVSGERILHVGERRWVIASLEERGAEFDEVFWPGILTPGLVNAHTHLQYTHLAQLGQAPAGTYGGFDGWDQAFDRVYAAQSIDWARSAADGAAQLLQSGCTAAADVVTDAEAITALHDADLHGIAYWEVMGWGNREWGSHGQERVVAEMNRIPPHPGAGVSPHAPYSLAIQPLLDIPDIVRQHGLRLHIHLAEAQVEHETSGTQADWHRLGAESFVELRGRGVGVSSTAFVDHLGVLGPDCHIAHGVYVTAADRALLRQRGTAVALCPRSNATIGLDEPPVAAYLSEGNVLAIGTDSLASSPSLDVLADAALLVQIARRQGYRGEDVHERVFAAATLGGAQAMGLNVGPRRVGQLSVGALSDLAFFAVDVPNERDALVALVEHGAGSAAATVLAGRIRATSPSWSIRHERNSHE